LEQRRDQLVDDGLQRGRPVGRGEAVGADPHGLARDLGARDSGLLGAGRDPPVLHPRRHEGGELTDAEQAVDDADVVRGGRGPHLVGERIEAAGRGFAADGADGEGDHADGVDQVGHEGPAEGVLLVGLGQEPAGPEASVGSEGDLVLGLRGVVGARRGRVVGQAGDAGQSAGRPRKREHEIAGVGQDGEPGGPPALEAGLGRHRREAEELLDGEELVDHDATGDAVRHPRGAEEVVAVARGRLAR
jgi:hypothetical protein